jgi:hypothetical protein
MVTTALFSVAGASAAAGSVSFVAGSPAKRTVLLDRQSNGFLTGVLGVAITSGIRTRARLTLGYLPTDGVEPARAGTVSFVSAKAPVLQPAVPISVSLRFTLPANASPTNLDGLVRLQLQRQGKSVGKPLLLQVEGAADPLPGITVVPKSATVQYTSWGGPFSRGDSTSLRVQLRGPGLGALFSSGRALPQPQVPLRTSNDAQLKAQLEQLTQTGDPAVANGLLKITGELDPGSYSGTVALSDLSPAAPSLAVKVRARDGFISALLAAFIGALIGGFWYLASSRRRRKDLLKAYVLDLLDRYSKRLVSLKRGHGDAPVPVWKLDSYLGKPGRWYSVKWSSAPELDGVRGIWSTIFWARNDQDLDQASTMVSSFRQRLIRWLRVADAVSALREVDELQPNNPTNRRPWGESNTVRDTELLLLHLRSIEPPDDATTEVLLDRIKRQARWHADLARTWHMKSRVEAHASQHPELYEAGRLGDIDLEQMDQAASPEETRSDEKQFPSEQRLDHFQAELAEMYRGQDPGQLVMSEREGPPMAVALGQLSAEQVRPGTGATLALWAPSAAAGVTDLAETVPPPPAHEAEAGKPAAAHALPAAAPGKRRRQPVRDAARRAVGGLTAPVRRAAGRPDRVGQAGTIMRAVVRRDLLWTVMIALITTAAYIPVLYNSTWGSLGDYGSAFVAGFLGKIAINWGLLPAFQALGLSTPGVTGLRAPAVAPGVTTTPAQSPNGATRAPKPPPEAGAPATAPAASGGAPAPISPS